MRVVENSHLRGLVRALCGLSLLVPTPAYAQLDAHHLLQPVVLRTTETTDAIRSSTEAARDLFVDEVMEDRGPVLVEFWSPTCLSCNQAESTVKELVAKHQGKIKHIRVNARLNPDIPLSYDIKKVPAIAVFKDGKLVEIVRFPNGNGQGRLAAALNRQIQ